MLSQQIDVRAFSRQQGELGGRAPLGQFSRLLSACELGGGVESLGDLTWQARGFERNALGEGAEPWIHLSLDAQLPLTCQRCLRPMESRLSFSGEFRFVADESTAQAQDDEAEEDVLSLEHPLNLLALVEDELIMALPIVPRHDHCAEGSEGSSQPPVIESETPHPFAALAVLKKAPDRL